MVFDEYAHSSLLRKLLKRKKDHNPLNIAFMDIDSTMTGSHASTNKIRNKLEHLGYIVVYVTARTEEMIMSSNSYNISCELGFSRPVPKLGRLTEKYVYIPPEQIEPSGLLDPDIIAGSTGTQILVKQKSGGYINDRQFEDRFTEVAESWREKALKMIDIFNTPYKRAYPALYEDPENYKNGLTNVYQPKFRITLNFQSAKEKRAFRTHIKSIQKSDSTYANYRMIDDSEPKKELHNLHLTPRNGSKTKAVDHIIHTIIQKAGVKSENLHVLIAGDGHADFDMGMRAARGTCATFLLSGGSRLMPALTCKEYHPDLLEDNLENLKTYFQASKRKGFYHSLMHTNRDLIICDEMYKGKTEALSILSFVSNLKPN